MSKYLFKSFTLSSIQSPIQLTLNVKGYSELTLVMVVILPIALFHSAIFMTFWTIGTFCKRGFLCGNKFFLDTRYILIPFKSFSLPSLLYVFIFLLATALLEASRGNCGWGKSTTKLSIVVFKRKSGNFSSGNFSWEDGVTLPQNSYKPSQNL